MRVRVGNQLLILLISFDSGYYGYGFSWESVTNPLDKLFGAFYTADAMLGISY